LKTTSAGASGSIDRSTQIHLIGICNLVMPDVNNLIALKLFMLEKADKLISAKIRKNPDSVINKYT
jgi:hypothetical protein